MDPVYSLRDPDSVFSPQLLFYKDVIRGNIAEAVRIAHGDPKRLRPHVKTHKTVEITKMALEAGVTKHKCATLAEAEMLANAGVPDVLIAYPLVGPNTTRLAKLVAKFPGTRFSVLFDHPHTLKGISDALAPTGKSVDVIIDLNVGMNRTGIAPGPEAIALYEQAGKLPGVTPGGIHAYDGHNSKAELSERQAVVKALLGQVLELRAEFEKRGLPAPRLIGGGTPSFPVWAALDVPGLECSPGTFALSDYNYMVKYDDLKGFRPAALVLTRVVSRTGPDRMTLDLGNKSIAADPPAGYRAHLLDIPDAVQVQQSEEHLVVRTPAAAKYTPGDIVYAVPAHVCPTCALHRQAVVVEDGRVTGQWAIASRDRVLTI
jgi:D-serine deaminase-like pyridoxal phosphate-dependent protein